MENYNEKLNVLFEKWKAKSIENGEEKAFCEDGLMYKYGHDKNYVDELWEKSKKRIMFLLKDPIHDSGDSRLWLNDPKNQQLKRKIMKRLAYILYGLTTVQNGETLDFGDIMHEQLVKSFNEIPFAYVESKKQAGTTKINNKELKRYINLYKEYLKEEINILKPNIVICFGEEQYHFAVTDMFKDAEKIDNNIHLHKLTNTLIICSYHPSYFIISNKSFYTDIMCQYAKFLAKYPDFQ
jgi:hypothetical protein